MHEGKHDVGGEGGNREEVDQVRQPGETNMSAALYIYAQPMHNLVHPSVDSVIDGHKDDEDLSRGSLENSSSSSHRSKFQGP